MQNILRWYMRSASQKIYSHDSVHLQGVPGRPGVVVAFETNSVEFNGDKVS